MELRVLKYFLMVAQEENITKAAALLHITQPTLSRQLMQLEEELGVKLFRRSGRRLVLTEDGALLKRRAQELADLSDKTIQELSHKDSALSGVIAVGCGETQSMHFLADQIRAFQQARPRVRFSIYSADADDIKERLERGILDLGLLAEPVDIGRYEFVRLPRKDTWGVLARRDSVLGGKDRIRPRDLVGEPLIMPRRDIVKTELGGWFGAYRGKPRCAGTYTLIVNAAAMVQSGVGAALCLDMSSDFYGDLCFIPLFPAVETGSVLVWKKNQAVSAINSGFIRQVKNALSAS